MNFLVIEDSKADSELLKRYISKRFPNAKVTVCNNFLNGAKSLYHKHHDAVFLDLNLPDNWGINSIKDIKKYAHTTPIVVTTGFANQTTIDEAMIAGASNVIEKRNLNSDLLARTIENHYMVG